MLGAEPRDENMAARLISIIGLIPYVCTTQWESLATCYSQLWLGICLRTHLSWLVGGSCCPREVQQCSPAVLSSSLSEAQHRTGSEDSSLCKIIEASTYQNEKRGSYNINHISLLRNGPHPNQLQSGKD